jgi:4-diphosphocytidyl-2-C-methyl-D-erythritol kinase
VTPAALPFTRLAHAKLNLRLEVGPASGGLHKIVSALAALDLADIVRFEPSPGGFAVLCNVDDVAEKDNLAWRAAHALGVRLPDVRVVIDKSIPMQAGLGGGSADAAATLQGIAAILAAEGVALEPERIAAAALRAGSDVPSYFASGTRIIEGVGDVVTARACAPPPWGIILLRPAVASSTANAYALLDQARVPHDLSHAVAAAHAICDVFCRGDFERTITLLHNDFSEAIEAALPAVSHAHERLQRAGARATILCGSGSCVAGFFEDDATAQTGLARLTPRDGEWITATTFARG